MTSKEILERGRARQTDKTDPSKSYAVFYGKDNDLLIALPHTERLTKNYKIYFSKNASEYSIMTIYSGNYTYKVLFNSSDILFQENGYYAIMGKYPHQKGLHKQPIHKLAYKAFYGSPPPGYHIHHIDKNKHNNSMENLVALSETEHEQVHQHPVSVGRSLFNAPKHQTLLSELKKEAQLASKQVTEYEEPLIVQMEQLCEASVSDLLSSPVSKAVLDELAERVIDNESNTTLVYLCKLYKTLEEVIEPVIA